MKALIAPNETPIKYISSWVEGKPVFSDYSNSCRVAQVSNEEFGVAEPLFWVDCSDEVRADQFYYDLTTNSIKAVVNQPKPEITA
jgi:hypothetical protein